MFPWHLNENRGLFLGGTDSIYNPGHPVCRNAQPCLSISVAVAQEEKRRINLHETNDEQ